MYASINLHCVQTTSLILFTMQYFHQQTLSPKMVKTPRQHSPSSKLPPASTNKRSNDSVLFMFITTNDVDESESNSWLSSDICQQSVLIVIKGINCPGSTTNKSC